MTSFDHDSRHLAETYDRLSDLQFTSGQRLVERMGIKAGDRVLDIGCGTGRLTGWIHTCVGPSGTVVGIDPLADRIAVARTRTEAIHFAVGSAEDLRDFADGSFDAVCLCAVFHWILDQPKALSEIHRVLRPGGRVGLSTVSKELYWSGTVALTCATVFSRSPYLEALDRSALGVLQRHLTTTELVGLLIGRQFTPVELHIERQTHALPSGEAVVDFAQSSSFGNFMNLIPEGLRTDLRTDLAEAFERQSAGHGIDLHQFRTICVAERPHHEPGK